MSSKQTVLFEHGTKLSATNYTVWKFSMQASLVAKDLWNLCLKKDASEGARVKNAEAKSLIWNSMEDSQKARVGNCETAHDLWVKIQDIYEGSKSTLQTRCLQEFLNVKIGPQESLQDFCTRFETLANKLNSTGYVMDEKAKIWAFKNSLPAHLYEKCDTWEMVEENPTVADLITLMRTRDRREKPSPSVALYLKNDTAKPSNPQRNKNASDIVCNYCKIKGHKWRDCRKKKSDDKRKKSFAQKKKPTEQAHMPSHNSPPNVNDNPASSQWVIDSGATKHMTACKSWITNYTQFDMPHEIYVGNGDSIKAYGQGDVKFTNAGERDRLVEVLYSPELKMNLFSVKQSTKQGFNVTFIEDKVEVRKDSVVKVIG